jgi:hypothetical protein
MTILTASRGRASARWLCTLAVGIGLLATPWSEAPAQESPDPAPGIDALQSTLFGFADKYMSVVAQATNDAEVRMGDNPKARSLLHDTKLASAEAVLSIATGPNSEVALLDMVGFATLHHMIWRDPWSAELFGPERDPIADRMEELAKDIWKVAAAYLDVEQIADLNEVIAGWRERNPDLRYVYQIRFSDFAEDREESKLAKDAKKRGFLPGVSQAAHSVNEMRLVVERAIEIGENMPRLVNWHAESLFYDLATSPELQQALADSASLSRSLERLALVAESLPESVASERRALFAELDARREGLKGAAEEVRGGLVEANRLAVSFGETSVALKGAFGSLERVLAEYNQALTGKEEPFRIVEYSAAIREFTIALQELNTLVQSAERATSESGGVGRLFDRVLYLGSVLIAIFCVGLFATLLAYRATAGRVFRADESAR